MNRIGLVVFLVSIKEWLLSFSSKIQRARRSSKIALFFLIGLAVSLTCLANGTFNEEAHMKYPGAAYYYEMPVRQIKNMLCKVGKLRKGDSYQRIVDMLGKPTYDKELYGKEGKAVRMIRVLDYYIKKYEKDLSNEHYDAYISIELDGDDKLVRVLYVNVEKRCEEDDM